MDAIGDIEGLMVLLEGASSAKAVGKAMCAAGLTGRANAALYLLALDRLGLKAPTPASIDRYLCARSHAPDYQATQQAAKSRWQKDNVEKSREYTARYKRANPDKSKDATVAWHKANPGRSKAMSAEWRRSNLDTARERQRGYMAQRRQSDPAFRFSQNVRATIGTALANGGARKSSSSELYLGCSLDHFRRHIEAQFVDGMRWDNHGEWHLDHVRPCASFDLTKEADRLACMHWSNWQPMWAAENIGKGSLWQGRRWRHGEAKQP